jgi:uncharacterized protein (TIGR02145 family)
MASNMNVGVMLASGATEPADNGITEKWCYDNDPAICATDGGLYNWNEAMQYVTTEGAQGICPTGWHLPTDAEYMAMEECLGMCSGTGIGPPKCSGATGWRGTDQGSKLSMFTLNGNNSSGFSLLLAGYRLTDGSFFIRSSYARIWSSSESGGSAWHRDLYSGYATVSRNANAKAYGFSVRCLKD